MPCDLASINADICASGANKLDDRSLMLATIGAALELGGVISAADANLEACEANLPGLSDRQLDEVLAGQLCILYGA